MKSAPAIMATKLAAGNIAKSEQISRPQDDFHMGSAAGLLERCDLIVKFLPSAAKDVARA